MNPAELNPGEVGGGQPDFLAVDVRQLSPDRYGKLLVYLADGGIPCAPLPEYATAGLGQIMVASAETDRALDFITKEQFIGFMTPEYEGENLRRTVGTVWQKLVRRAEWARQILKTRPEQYQGKTAVMLLMKLFVELPGDDGPSSAWMRERCITTYIQSLHKILKLTLAIKEGPGYLLSWRSATGLFGLAPKPKSTRVIRERAALASWNPGMLP